MTFEEFKNLALNPPKTNEPAIFRLKVLHIGGLPEHRKTHYPKYKVYEHSTYIFKSVEDAEKVIFSLSEKKIPTSMLSIFMKFHLKELCSKS